MMQPGLLRRLYYRVICLQYKHSASCQMETRKGIFNFDSRMMTRSLCVCSGMKCNVPLRLANSRRRRRRREQARNDNLAKRTLIFGRSHQPRSEQFFNFNAVADDAHLRVTCQDAPRSPPFGAARRLKLQDDSLSPTSDAQRQNYLVSIYLLGFGVVVVLARRRRQRQSLKGRPKSFIPSHLIGRLLLSAKTAHNELTADIIGM